MDNTMIHSINIEELNNSTYSLYGKKQVNGTYTIDFVEKMPNDTLSSIAVQQIKLLDAKVLQELKTCSTFITIYTDGGIKSLELFRVPRIENDKIVQIDTELKEFELGKSVKNKEKMQQAMKEIAKMFMSLNSSNYDDVLNFCIEKVGHALDADRSYIFEYDFNRNVMDNTYEWTNEGINPEIDNLKNIPISDFLDGWVNEHRNNKTVLIENVQKLDPESNIFQILDPQGIKSLFTMPLYEDGECKGFLGFDAVNSYQTWSTIPPIIDVVPLLITGAFKRREDIFAIHKAKLELEHSQDSINEFLAKLNHEIKTPLVGLTNAAEMLRATSLTNEQIELLETIDYSTESLGNLVGNISSEFRGGADEPTLNNTEFILEEELVKLIGMNKQLANSKKLGLYLTYDYSLPKIVSTDKSKLRQTLNNLIQNGIRYTNYGHVELKVSKVEHIPPYVDIKFEISDTGIGISRENVDKLFDSFYREKHTTYGKPTGTGLGLNIANNMVDLMGGKIEVDTEKFAGSTFHFTLKLYSQEVEMPPVIDKRALLIDITMNYHSNIKDLLETTYQEVIYCDYEMQTCCDDSDCDIIFIHTNDEENYISVEDELLHKINEKFGNKEKILLYDNAKKAAYIEAYPLYDDVKEVPCTISTLQQVRIEGKGSKQESPSLKISENIKVLLVEDNNINRKIMVKLLENLNLDVTEAVDGFDALDIVMDQKFDIIFMDVFMPGMNGYETTKRIRSLDNINSSVPIFAVSANELEKTKTEGMEYGMNGALEKPLTSKTVTELLNRVFKSETSVDSFDKYPIFDPNTFESMYDPELGKEIIDTFIEEYDTDFKKVKDAFESKDYDDIHKSIHYMKGTFTYLGAERLKKLTQKVLQLSTDEEFEKVLSYEEMYFSNLQQLKKELENYKTN